MRMMRAFGGSSCTALCVSAGAGAAAPAPLTQTRGMKVKQTKFFAAEALPHGRRVSWAPQTTAKKQGVFAKLSRSNFYDRRDAPFSMEPYCEEQVEAHRNAATADVYIYKYTVTPTHFALRP
jgi:hypothetical protein